jgi:hypothetical protein
MLPSPTTAPRERLAGTVERATVHSEQSRFFVLRVKVKGQRNLMTVIFSAASVSGGGVEPRVSVLGALQERPGVSARRACAEPATVG